MEENRHFDGIVPIERWRNDVLNELRQIRKLLERDAQTVQVTPEVQNVPTQRRTRQRKGVKP
jgi:hypothetical protein